MSMTLCVDCGTKQAVPRTGRPACLLCGGTTILLRGDSELDRPAKVFICSPLRGDYEANYEAAVKTCRRLAKQGILPIAPHVYFPCFLDDNKPDERRLGIRLGLELMASCNELWFYGDTISKGMREELIAADRLRIPIRHKSF